MEKEKYEHLLSLVTSQEKENDEQIVSRVASRDNFNMWGKLPADDVGKNVGGWLIGSWSVGAAPYWIPKMHYYSREDRKLYIVRPKIALAKMALSVDQEDKDLDPERARFLTENIDTWERETQPVAS
jgi:hypothetical protein